MLFLIAEELQRKENEAKDALNCELEGDSHELRTRVQELQEMLRDERSGMAAVCVGRPLRWFSVLCFDVFLSIIISLLLISF